MKAEAESGGQEASRQAVPGATGSRSSKGRFSPGAFRDSRTLPTPRVWPPNCNGTNTCSVKQPVCNNLLQKSQEANATPVRKLGAFLLLSRLALWADPEPVLGKAVGTTVHGFHA